VSRPLCEWVGGMGKLIVENDTRMDLGVDVYAIAEGGLEK
jgi:hypothetical protein